MISTTFFLNNFACSLEGAAPTVLAAPPLPFPALRRWARLCRAYGAWEMLCDCSFAKRGGVVGDGSKRDAVLTRGFDTAGNRVSLGIANHQGGESLLQRVSGAMLLLESG